MELRGAAVGVNIRRDQPHADNDCVPINRETENGEVVFKIHIQAEFGK